MYIDHCRSSLLLLSYVLTHRTITVMQAFSIDPLAAWSTWRSGFLGLRCATRIGWNMMICWVKCNYRSSARWHGGGRMDMANLNVWGEVPKNDLFFSTYFLVFNRSKRLPPHTFLIPPPRDQTRVCNRLEHGAMMDNHQATASSPWI